jgi:hypothetical protein
MEGGLPVSRRHVEPVVEYARTGHRVLDVVAKRRHAEIRKIRLAVSKPF